MQILTLSRLVPRSPAPAPAPPRRPPAPPWRPPHAEPQEDPLDGALDASFEASFDESLAPRPAPAARYRLEEDAEEALRDLDTREREVMREALSPLLDPFSPHHTRPEAPSLWAEGARGWERGGEGGGEGGGDGGEGGEAPLAWDDDDEPAWEPREGRGGTHDDDEEDA